MATSNGRTAEQVRQDIEAERERLATAVDDLRSGIDEATDINAKLKSKLPAATAAAFATGFVLAGGLRATVRLGLQRYRENKKKRGPFSLFDRD